MKSANFPSAPPPELYFYPSQWYFPLPVMDGIQAARTIRSSGIPHALNVPIVAMTAHALLSDRQKSLEAGMNDHITKPIDVKELQKIL